MPDPIMPAKKKRKKQKKKRKPQTLASRFEELQARVRDLEEAMAKTREEDERDREEKKKREARRVENFEELREDHNQVRLNLIRQNFEELREDQNQLARSIAAMHLGTLLDDARDKVLHDLRSSLSPVSANDPWAAFLSAIHTKLKHEPATYIHTRLHARLPLDSLSLDTVRYLVDSDGQYYNLLQNGMGAAHKTNLDEMLQTGSDVLWAVRRLPEGSTERAHMLELFRFVWGTLAAGLNDAS
ncbi:hypothetical protein DFH06DRAFT_1289768 [Mycena polygramma]|nr:hypothetical protein DFH06DRAFT_1289768 [Mycena polygramma]